MPEIVGTFLSNELRDERANRSSEARNSSCGNLAQESFELAVRHLDRIEVRRVLRQVTNCAPRFLDRLPNAGTHVDSAVIHYDNVFALERRNQALLDIGEEHLSGHGTLNHHWRGHFIVAQGGHEGDRLPCSKRHGANHPAASYSPAIRDQATAFHERRNGIDGGSRCLATAATTSSRRDCR